MSAQACQGWRRGRVVFRRPASSPLVSYYAYHAPGSRHVLVAVHGVSRNAREHAHEFATLAGQLGVSLVCPLFEAAVYPDYQRLGRRGGRADLGLDAILQDFARSVDVNVARFDLFGFSGGAQFAHRYALGYPKRIRRLALAAPGWFTFPDSPRRYPWGPCPTPRLDDVCFDVERFLDVPALVMVGGRDRARDESLRTSRRLDSEQGRHRVARARNWVNAVNAAARVRGKPDPAVLRLLDDAGHDFTEALAAGMARMMFEFFDTKETCNANE